MPDLIQKKIQDSGLPYVHINGGYRGDTSGQALSKLKRYLSLSPSGSEDVCVIELGTNDWMQGYSVADIESNLTTILAALRSSNSAMVLALIEMRSFPGFRQGEEYDSLFYKFSKKNNIALIPFPLTAVLTNDSLLQSDGVHPNAKGTEIYADEVWKYLFPLL